MGFIEKGTENTSVDVCLVMPPTSYCTGPSLALGLLKAELVQSGLSCCVDYADVRFIKAMGKTDARIFCAGNLLDFLGEYIFAGPAGIVTAKGKADMEVLFRDMFAPLDLFDRMCLIERACRVAEEETEKTAERILKMNPKMVGVSSTFNQRNGAVAILKRIKQLRPDIVTAMGGANCFGPAGIAMLEKFDCIDYVFLGESDDIFADVCRKAIEAGPDGSFELPYGVMRRGDPVPEIPPHRIVEDLDSIPFPDYDDFFELLSEGFADSVFTTMKTAENSGIALFIESSRGCTWGERNPCTFCGLMGKIRRYRKKSTKRLFDEMCFLSDRYGISRLYFTDCLMPEEWVNELAPMIRESGRKFVMFTELRTTLSENQIRALAEAGLIFVQPGVESLSDNVLRLMHKGVTAAQNLSFLKFAKKYGMKPSWNILFGFPGETLEDYREQIELLPLIEHFEPFSGSTWILYARDNEYASNPEKFGLKLVPSAIYGYTCPNDPEYIASIAYYFDSVSADVPEELLQAGRDIISAGERWQEHVRIKGGHVRLDCAVNKDGRSLLVIDTRSCRRVRAQLLLAAEMDVCLACAEPRSERFVYMKLEQQYSRQEIETAVENLIAKKLMYRSASGVLLALPIEYTFDELVRREVSEFQFEYYNNEGFSELLDREMASAAAEFGNTDETAASVAGSFAKKLSMCFTGEDYLEYALPFREAEE